MTHRTILRVLLVAGTPLGHSAVLAASLDEPQLRRGVVAPSRSPACRSIEGPFIGAVNLANTPVTGGLVEVELRLIARENTPITDVTLIPLEGAVIESDVRTRLLGMTAGEERVVTVTYSVSGPGEGGVEIAINGISVDACGERTGPGISLGAYSVDDGARVFTSTRSFIEAQDIRLSDAVARGALTPEQAQAEADAIFRGPVVPIDLSAPAGTSFVPSPTTAGETNITGTLQWQDSQGNPQPAAFVEVRAYTSGLLGESEVYSGSTGVDGEFSVDIADGDIDVAGESVRIEFFARNSATNVRTAPEGTFQFFSNNTYARSRSIPVARGIDTSTGPILYPNTDLAARAFSIAGAMLEGFFYVGDVEGSFPRRVDTNFSATGAGSFFNGSDIAIDPADPFDWDVILHEYGHFLADFFDPDFDNNPGGYHALGADLTGPFLVDDDGDPMTPPITINYGKQAGERLSWGEGIATYIGTAAMVTQRTYLSGVPQTNDVMYSDRDIRGMGGFTYSVENRDIAANTPGDGNEVSVTRVLWDLADSDTDFGSQRERGDDLALGHTAIWQNLRQGFTNLSGYWNATAGPLPAAEKVEHGAVFAMNKIAPQPVAPADGDEVTEMSPTFKWKVNTRDTFQILFFNADFSSQIGTLSVPPSVAVATEAGEQVATYTPTTAEWEPIYNAVTEDTFNYVITGQNTVTPITAVYWSGATELRTMSSGDFVFVIDDTGSMGSEIGSVRNALTAFLDAFPEDTSDRTFQLITFKDNVREFAPTNDLAVIRDQVADLRASGGGDCPENSVAALNAAVNNLGSGGLIQFATDADPRPGTSITAVIREAQRRGIRVNVLLSSVCSDTLAGGIADDGPNSRFVADFNNDGRLSIDDVTAFTAAYQSRSLAADFGDAVDGLVNINDLRAFLDAYSAETYSDGPAFDPLGEALPDDLAAAVFDGFENAFAAYNELALATGGSFSFVPEVKSNAEGRARYEAIASNILAAEIEPRVVSIQPPTIPRGSSVRVTLQGQNVTFTPASTVSVPAGITVLSTTFIDPTRIDAVFAVAGTTPLGAVDVTVSTPLGDRLEAALGDDLLTVDEASVLGDLLAASPSSLPVGESGTLRLSFVNTDFTGSTPSVTFSSGITVDAVRVVSATEIDVDITIPETALPGFRTITVTNPTAGRTFTGDPGLFFVRSVAIGGDANIASLSATTITAGSTLRLTIAIEGTAPVPGGTSATISGEGITVSNITVCETDVILEVTVSRSAPSGARDLTIAFGDVFIARPNGITIEGFVTRADVNRDTVVDLEDLRQILGVLGRSTSESGVSADIDLDGDGFVSIADFRLWQSDYFGGLNEAAGITPTLTAAALAFEAVDRLTGTDPSGELSSLIQTAGDAADASADAGNLVGLTLAGRPLPLASPDGTPTLVAVFSSWHPLSDEMITELDAIALQADAPRLIGVAARERDINDARRLTRSVSFPVMLGDANIVRRLGLRGSPGVVILDPTGATTHVFDGFTPAETLAAARRAIRD